MTDIYVYKIYRRFSASFVYIKRSLDVEEMDLEYYQIFLNITNNNIRTGNGMMKCDAADNFDAVRCAIGISVRMPETASLLTMEKYAQTIFAK